MDQRGDQHLYTNYVLLSVVAFVLQLHIAVSKGCHNSPYRIRSMLCTNIDIPTIAGRGLTRILCATSTAPNPRARTANASACPSGHACSPQESPQPGPVSQQSRLPFAPPQFPSWLRVAEATRVIAPKFLMVPLLAQKAGLDDKVKVFVCRAHYRND
jgi:hypothetical protein